MKILLSLALFLSFGKSTSSWLLHVLNSGKEDGETRLFARSVEGGFEFYDLTS